MNPLVWIKANKLLVGLGAALLVAALFLLTYCQGRTDGRQGEVVGQLKRETQVQNQVSAANEKASVARVGDAVRGEQQQKELNDALQATNDPDQQRALRGCAILRQQGRDTSNIPACTGSKGR